MFSKVLGQTKAITQLKKFILSGRIPPAMLFYGPQGVGKAMSAQYFAMALNCADSAAKESGDACGVCLSCKNILAGTHPDYIFAGFNYQAQLTGKEVEKQQHINVETIRSITAKSQQKAVLGGYKIIVVDRAETMQSEAANALLKFIEEPPYKTVWILISSKRESMLSTIKSRSQAVTFASLPEDVMVRILEGFGHDESVIKKAAKYCGGSVSRGIAVIDVLSSLNSLNPAEETFPYEVAATLNRTLAVGRIEASLILDILSTGLHNMWATSKDDKIRESIKTKLNQISHYKKAVWRNVSPSMVVEAALMETDKFNEEVFK
ncbi:DNA polymerase-3 subunit delta' [Elusimicrobium simillimum]|uniref:DNA polymerase III subunit delta' n=1 Tax=Elusimicrobium simillimum TaxID=3143438 RepID=UPI003C6F3BD2